MKLTTPKRKDKKEALAAAFVQQAMTCGVADEVLKALLAVNGIDKVLGCGCKFSDVWGYQACKDHKSYSAPRTCFCGKVAEMVPKTSTAFRTGAVDTAKMWREERKRHFKECTGVAWAGTPKSAKPLLTDGEIERRLYGEVA